MPAGIGATETRWRYLAYAWGAGATLLTLIVATTAGPPADRVALLAICAAGLAGVAVMFAGAGRLPAGLFQPTVLVSNMLISLVVYFSGDPASLFAMYYLWLNVYVCYFFEPRLAWAQSAGALAAYAVTLAVMPGAFALEPWLMTAGTMAFIGTMVASLTGRVERLVATLADEADHDPLTGLLNRRGFDEAFAGELERARRSELPLGLVTADIDHFKRVNDSAGHARGDEILQRLAVLLTDGVRQIDGVARIGGEEFAILVPDTGAEGACVLAERLRRQVQAALGDGLQPITMSFGIAAFPTDGAGAGELLRAADNALYAAKRLGRNQTVSCPRTLQSAAGSDRHALQHPH